MNANHIVRAFDTELTRLGGMIASMGGQAERLVEQSVTALVRGDGELARELVAADAAIDETQRRVDDHAILLIARRQPMATDLREIIGALRISADLERVGDMGKGIAKRVEAVEGVGRDARFLRGLEALSELALTQLKDVLDIYASRAVGRIAAVRDRDNQIDAVYTSLFRELLSEMMADPRNITACTHLLFCAKNIERVGDHATNIVETVHFMVTGQEMPLERPKEDSSHAVTGTGTA